MQTFHYQFLVIFIFHFFRSFWDLNGILITPQKEQPTHYHFNLSCIRAVAPTFVSFSLLVPLDVGPKLSVVHKENLNLAFNVTGNWCGLIVFTCC